MTSPAEKRVAVVGSGIAGLTAAHLIARKHHVTLYERESTLGMDAHSVRHHRARVDIPLRVFSEAYYPNLCKLYKLIGIAYHSADYSFSLLRAVRAPAAYFRYANIFHKGACYPYPSLGMLLYPPTAAKYAHLLFSFVHFLMRSPAYIAEPSRAGLTLDAFLVACGYSREFATEMLYPMLSVVCTCSFESVSRYPAALIVDYFADKYGLSGAQCRAYQGTSEIVSRLSKPVQHVVLGASVSAVCASKTSDDSPCVTWIDADGTEHSAAFDEVVVATQANVGAHILQTPHAEQLDALGSFKYERFRVCLHEDATLMPPRRSDWCPLNITAETGARAASVTVWMNRLDADLDGQLDGHVFQTWNPTVEPAKDKVVVDVAFDRPVVTRETLRAMSSLQEAQGAGHVWFVGAYARPSMPLLENGVKSAIEVAKSLGIDCSDVEYSEEAVRAKGGTSWMTPQLLFALLSFILAISYAALAS